MLLHTSRKTKMKGNFFDSVFFFFFFKQTGIKGKQGPVFYTSFQMSVKADFSASSKFTTATWYNENMSWKMLVGRQWEKKIL